jgi:Tol biopolymer transport system component
MASLGLTGAGSTQQLVATLKDANGNTLSGRTVEWSSSDLAVAKVDASGVVSAVATGKATITATSEGKAGTAEITVGPPPEIWVNTGSVQLTVQQGQTTSKDIYIDGAKGSKLTNISTGPFSSYFTGAPAPWVTASLSSTSSPSTLTITASPSLSQEASSYQLRFEIYSPGAVNSPFTIYSVNVTVIPAGVTPTGATITPSAAGVGITATQGGSGSNTLTITNGGEGTLANLAVSSLTNYFTGADMPWVTASLNTTTAPATITVTARPTFSVAPGHYQLRFEITSPGATNSPLTIYGVHVDVVAGVPSPTLLFIASPLAGCCFNDVYTQRLDGSERTRLTNQPMAGEFRPRWSPDGSKIIFDRGGQLFRMNADGSSFEMLTNSGVDGSYSPDGSQIVFGRGFRIWIMDASGANQRQLSFTAGRDEGTPSIDRDGWIVFAANDAAGQSVYLWNPATGEETPLTNDRVSTYPSFSPDGKKILYNSGRSIYVMDRDGGNKTLLSYDPAVNGFAVAPTWGPDGTTVAFKGLQGFYVMNADGTNLKLLRSPADAAQNYPSIRPGAH